MNIIKYVKNSKSGNYSYIFLPLASSLVLFALLVPAKMYGDGGYYYATLISLATDGWPAMSESSRQLILSAFNLDVYKALSSQGVDGNYYSWHFWFYSLINIPAYYFLSLFGIDTFKSFQLTNSILTIATVYYLAGQSRFTHFTKAFVVLMYLLVVSIPYILWTHPEVFSASLLLIACFEFINNRVKTTIILAALASYQNPSISLFLVPVYLYYLFSLRFHKKLTFIEIIYKFIPVVCISFLVFVPYIWYYSVFRMLNPIAQSLHINYFLISFDRLHSFFFDLNQGMIVSALPLIAGSVIYFFYKMVNKIKPNKYDLLLIALFLIVMPTLAQVNWNPGQSISLRYITWAAMPLLVWLALQLEEYRTKLVTSVLVFFISLQMLLVFSVYGGIFAYKSPSSVQHKPWVERIWNINPKLYNPIPEIFYERTLGREGKPKSPVEFRNASGDLVKLLIKNDLDYEQYICGDSASLIKESISYNLVKLEQGYVYLNGPFDCRYSLPSKIHAKNIYDKNAHGWSSLEDWGFWSNTNKTELSLKSINIDATEKIKLVINGHVFSDGNFSQKVIVKHKGVKQMYESTSRISIPLTINSADLQNTVIYFELPDAISPKEMGLSNDSRKLGLGISSIELTKP